MKRAWLLLPVAALATLIVIPLTTAFGDDEPSEPSIFAVDLGADFTYQGRFMDDGAPADGEYDVRFILYDADSGGTQVGATVTKENIAVSDGLFTTTLNFGAESFNGDARWLEIAVRPGDGDTFTVLNPRQPVTAVPYALHALTAGGFTPPLDITGSLDADPLVDVSQDGEAGAIEVTRGAATGSADAFSVTNAGPGSAIFASSGADGGIGVEAEATGLGGFAGTFRGNTAILIDGALQVGPVNPAAFRVVAETSDNVCDAGGVDDALVIESPMTDGNAFALIFITADGNGAFPGDTALFVDYDAPGNCPEDVWVVRRMAGSWLDDMALNVLVISQTIIQ